MDIDNVGKGALPDLPDDRDYMVDKDILGAATVDWSKEFRLPEPPPEDQGSSDSCVAQSWSYYHWQLHGKNYSRRDLFCRIAINYGAYIRDGGKELVGSGQATRDEVSDPNPETPQNMRDASGTKPEYRSDDQELNYFRLSHEDINGVAWGIQNYKGVVFGVNGSNPGWQDMKNPRPPLRGETLWGHALYAMGCHTHDGQKCIIAKSSWSKYVSEHHIKENYYLTGNAFSVWTLIPKEQSMTNSLIVKNGDELGIYDPATSEDGLITLMRNRGMDVPLTPDGKLDFSKITITKTLS
ncbi:MAG: hypothetical protein ACR2N3_17830 [Pyrinomonadaceae bacterium]